MSDSPADRFRISTGEHLGHQVVSLADWHAETQAILVPSYGFPCIAFRLRLGSQAWHVLSEPPDASAFVTRPTRYGIPILFPWPNRLREGRFSFEGREYQLPMAPGAQHASHGFVRQRPWTVDAAGTDARGAFCRASIRIGENADDAWPFPCRLTLEYRLDGRTLHLQAQAENVGMASMPMGFGIHPWFDVPFGSAGTRADMEIRAPASGYWELDETLCTTGRIRPMADGFDARDWRPIEDRFVDDVFTGLELQDDWFTAEIRDPANGRTISVRSDSQFREHVVFAPLHSQVVCLEPYTCTTDAFNLTAQGLDAGLIVLAPGETWAGNMEIVASA